MEKLVDAALPQTFLGALGNPFQRGQVSPILPQKYPAYILHLNRPQDFHNFSFREVLSGSEDLRRERFSGKSVFIGSHLQQKRNPDQRAYTKMFVRTALDPKTPLPAQPGTAMHLFWAQHAQLFMDDALPTIAPLWLVGTLATLVVLLVIMSMVLGSPQLAMGIYFAFTLLGPVANGWAIAQLGFYVPLFDSLFAGLVTFLELAFLKLSMESFRFRKLASQQRNEQDTIESKGHFIALISHNLNTPVAKMQGMLTLLQQFSGSKPLIRDTHSALSLLSQIQLCIRSVLVNTALDEGQLKHEAMSLQAIRKEFQQSIQPVLQRLGYGLELRLDCDQEEHEHMPVRFDRRALVSTLGLMIALIQRQRTRKRLPVSLRLSLEEADHEEEYWLHCEVACEHSQPSHAVLCALRGRVRTGGKPLPAAVPGNSFDPCHSRTLPRPLEFSRRNRGLTKGSSWGARRKQDETEFAAILISGIVLACFVR